MGMGERRNRSIEPGELPDQFREAPIAGGFRPAALEYAIECALRFDRDLRHQRDRRRHDRVQHDRARALGITPGVVLRDARAVGTADQVDPLVAEGGAHGLEVADRDAGRVELRAAAQPRQAVARDPAQLDGREFAGLDGVVRHVAVEPVRAAGAALVHQHEIALAPDAGIGTERRRIAFDRALARPAREQEDRIGIGARRDRRHDRNGELDFHAVGFVGIFGDGELRALRGDRDQVVGVADSAFLERGFRIQGFRAGHRADREDRGQGNSPTHPIAHDRSIPAAKKGTHPFEKMTRQRAGSRRPGWLARSGRRPDSFARQPGRRLPVRRCAAFYSDRLE